MPQFSSAGLRWHHYTFMEMLTCKWGSKERLNLSDFYTKINKPFEKL